MQKPIVILFSLVGLLISVRALAEGTNQVATNRISNSAKIPSDAEFQDWERYSVSKCSAYNEEHKSLFVTTNDVVLIKRPSGAVAVVQFTGFGAFSTNSVPLTASYRWRFRSAPSQPVKSGKGRVCESYDRKPSAHGKGFDVTPRADHDITVKAGDIWIDWSYHNETSGWLYYYPSRATIQVLSSDDFDRDL